MKKEERVLLMRRLEEMFPEAKSELRFENIYQIVVSVMLSAQTTDVRVNMVTPALFARYPSFKELQAAQLSELESFIQSVGLFKSKAKHLIGCAQKIETTFHGIVPNTMEELVTLPGVGRKTASVVLMEGYQIPAFPVDTHVHRVSKRLGLAARKDDPLQTELKLRKAFPSEKWRSLHHQMIFLGRYVCQARKPDCEHCRLNDICPKKPYQ